MAEPPAANGAFGRSDGRRHVNVSEPALFSALVDGFGDSHGTILAKRFTIRNTVRNNIWSILALMATAGRRKRRMDPEFYERFKVIVEAAESIGISQTDLASMMGLASSTITRLRAGDPASVRLESGLRLCERFGLDPWLFAYGRPRNAAQTRLPSPADAMMSRDLPGSLGAISHDGPPALRIVERHQPDVEELVAAAVAEHMKPVLARLREVNRVLAQRDKAPARRQRK